MGWCVPREGGSAHRNPPSSPAKAARRRQRRWSGVSGCRTLKFRRSSWPKSVRAVVRVRTRARDRTLTWWWWRSRALAARVAGGSGATGCESSRPGRVLPGQLAGRRDQGRARPGVPRLVDGPGHPRRHWGRSAVAAVALLAPPPPRRHNAARVGDHVQVRRSHHRRPLLPTGAHDAGGSRGEPADRPARWLTLAPLTPLGRCCWGGRCGRTKSARSAKHTRQRW